ncbi:cytochrome-c peroxidase [Vibrio sp. Of7-15]|uniref:cytochrome-c peroxidase n=1 Tax=Vibrio sp. Of7-15 TaxID=2724879 RepID=UPI001EF19A6E|nr:cytochrome-c peroxidase [Vibrio sp. Of7-15]MCG7498018.1 cytochrome-c peroxidase [Vibrio sp. Of7-15]
MSQSISLKNSLLVTSILFGISGCHDSESQTSNHASPPTTSQPFQLSAQVDHDLAGGSTFLIRQPSTNIEISGVTDNNKHFTANVPAGVRLKEPLQISIALGQDTYKYLTANVETLNQIATKSALSQRALSTLDNTSVSVANTITLTTTAEFALSDVSKDGWLSQEEIVGGQTQSAQGDYEDKKKDLMIAAQVSSDDTSKLFYASSYELMVNLATDAQEKSAFFALNSEAVQAAKQTLFNIEPVANNEIASFLRLDQSGWPLQDQTAQIDTLAWSCVDDIRRVASKDYGTRLWTAAGTELVTAEGIQETIDEMNSSAQCNNTQWRLPKAEELAGLFKDGQLAFPNSFPQLVGKALFWAANADNVPTLVSLDDQGNLVPAETEKTSGMLSLYSFTPVDVWTNIPAFDTPVDVPSLRDIYAQPSDAWPAPTVAEGVEWQELGLKPSVPFPVDNPYSISKVELGKVLFFDKRLSKDDTVSCGSCHDPEKGWADGVRNGIGIGGEVGKRNTPTIINTAYYETLFLDGRVQSLEEQSLHPIANPIEMGLPLNELLQKLDGIAEYRPLFHAAFGDETITLDRIAKALATFERTIISNDSAFDKFLAGDTNAMTDQQLHGLHLFRTKAKCMNCHSGPMMTNDKFENIGLVYYGHFLEDRGRYNVTYEPEDMGKFRVSMLRDIKATDPTTHVGLFPLSMKIGDRVFGLLAMYNNGMTRNRPGNFPQYAAKYDHNFPEVSPLIERLGMTSEELLALDAFMSAITAEIRQDSASAEEMGLIQ